MESKFADFKLYLKHIVSASFSLNVKFLPLDHAYSEILAKSHGQNFDCLDKEDLGEVTGLMSISPECYGRNIWPAVTPL